MEMEEELGMDENVKIVLNIIPNQIEAIKIQTMALENNFNLLKKKLKEQEATP